MERWTLPAGWQWLHLSAVANDTDRRNPTLSPDEYFSYVDIASINNERGAIDDDLVKLVKGSDAPSRARKVIHKGNIIFATTRPYLKNIAIVPGRYDNQICSTGFCVLSAKAEVGHPEYIYNATRSAFFIDQLIPKQRGANYPAVSDDDVFAAEIPIPYPNDPARSLAEQHRIVARLEALLGEVRELRQLQAEIEADVGRLMEAVIRDVFDQPNNTWRTSPISDVALIQTGTAKGRHFGSRRTVELPYLRVANVQAGALDLGEVKTIAIAEDEIDRYRLQPGDLLLTEGGDHDKLGRGAVWEGQIDPCVHQNHIFAVRFGAETVLPRFAEYEMQSWHARSYFLGVAKKTTNLATINRTKLGAFPLLYPTLPEQRRIVAQLDAAKAEITQMIEAQSADCTMIEQMEQSILALAFRGEL